MANIETFTLKNKHGIEAKVISLGATLVSLKIPDKNGKFADVVLGYDNAEDYMKDKCYFGCTVGRFANRIANAKFSIDGKEYKLANNDGKNHLHGGIVGFNKVLWKSKPFNNNTDCGVVFEYLSPDGEESYPGNLKAVVKYTLTDNNELSISYEATTDKKTIINLTNHSYFNLAGHNAGDILSHQIQINADKFTGFNAELLPTGELCPVKGTAFDFTQTAVIGKNISKTGIGYDLNYVLNKKTAEELSFAAMVIEPLSGRQMEIFTTEPGVQFYTSNFLNGIAGKSGTIYQKHGALCLETQHYPDSPNQPNFPSPVLLPGKIYRHLTVHKFSVA
jgi:aldose 1-epimerase